MHRLGNDWSSEYDPATGRLRKRFYPDPDLGGAVDPGIFEEWKYESDIDSGSTGNRLREYRNQEGERTCYQYTGGPSGDDTAVTVSGSLSGSRSFATTEIVRAVSSDADTESSTADGGSLLLRNPSVAAHRLVTISGLEDLLQTDANTQHD